MRIFLFLKNTAVFLSAFTSRSSAKYQKATDLPYSARRTETKFDWPRHLQNQVEIEEDGREYAYLGEAVELWMQGLNIKGKARLSKLEKHKTIKNNWKVTNWFPPIIEAQPQTRTSYTPLWSFESNEYCNFVSSRGMVERDYKWSCDYRGA